MEQVGDVDFQLPEAATERGKLGCIGSLVRETQDAMRAEGTQDGAEILVRQGLSEVDALDPGAEGLAAWDDAHGVPQQGSAAVSRRPPHQGSAARRSKRCDRDPHLLRCDAQLPVQGSERQRPPLRQFQIGRVIQGQPEPIGEPSVVLQAYVLRSGSTVIGMSPNR